MRRRTFILSVVGVATLLGGCLSFRRNPVAADVPDSISSVEFATTRNPPTDPPQPPEVEFRSERRLAISQVVATGPKDCTGVRLNSIEHNADRLVVEAGSYPTGGACDGVEIPAQYDITMAFDQSPPDTVVVRTHSTSGEYEETTVERPTVSN
jgi:hypothetical protein